MIPKEISLLLKNGDLKNAYNKITSTIDLNVTYTPGGNRDIVKAIRFWENKFDDLESIPQNFDKGMYIINSWISCIQSNFSIKKIFQNQLYSLKTYIFSQAIIYFDKIISHSFNKDIYLNIARSYKEIGEYEKASIHIKKCANHLPNDAQVLAELADILDFSGNSKMAKLYFREAFFISPENVELSFLESPIILKMIEKILEKEYNNVNEYTIKNLIPIYGNIYGVLHVKRELKSNELGKLNSAIFELERITNLETIDKLKLINHYFWLIDSIQLSASTNANSRKTIEPILQKISNLNSEIYEDYTK